LNSDILSNVVARTTARTARRAGWVAKQLGLTIPKDLANPPAILENDTVNKVNQEENSQISERVNAWITEEAMSFGE